MIIPEIRYFKNPLLVQLLMMVVTPKVHHQGEVSLNQ